MSDWEAHGPDAFGDFNISSKGEKLAKCVVVQNGFRPPEETAAIAAHLIKAVNSHNEAIGFLELASKSLWRLGDQAAAHEIDRFLGRVGGSGNG